MCTSTSYVSIHTCMTHTCVVLSPHHSHTRRLLSSEVVTNLRFSSTNVIVLTAPRCLSYSCTTSPDPVSHCKERRDDDAHNSNHTHLGTVTSRSATYPTVLVVVAVVLAVSYLSTSKTLFWYIFVRKRHHYPHDT